MMQTRGAYENRQSLQARMLALRIGSALLFVLMAIAFWILQVVQHQRYAEIAANNHIRSITLRAPRGEIFDRENRVLVQNRSSFTIALVRERSGDIDDTLERLAEYTDTDVETLRTAYDRHKNEPVFRAIPLLEHASMAQVASVMLHGPELPDIDVLEGPTRSYPDERLGAHVFGYVTEISSRQLEGEEFAGITPGSFVGQTGLERAYNSLLMGVDGQRRVVVDSRGREIEPFGMSEPTSGNLVQLTIDYDLQRALEDAFKYYGFNGGAVFIEPSSGEVLAMTSLPAYDPNAFASGIDSEAFAALTNDPLRPFYNRMLQDRYMPGSTFKVAMAIAGLASGAIDPTHREYCTGSVTIYGQSRACHKAGGHGWVDVREAIKQSCNVFFYKLGERMSIDVIHDYAAQMGLVGRTGIDLPNEVPSNIPSTAQREAQGRAWYPGETISVAIGQGPVDVTPLGLATMVATVANGGMLIRPHVVRATAAPNEAWTPRAPEPALGHLNISPELLDVVRDGMWMAVNEPGGTAYNWARIDGMDIAGKTGTAQVISFQGAAEARARGTTRDLREHGWFIFYGPRDNAQIAGVVFGEHADHGYLVAPIARHVLETFFAKRQGRPGPILPARSAAATPPAAPDGAGLPEGR